MAVRRLVLPRVEPRMRSTAVPNVVLERSGRWWAASLPSFPGAYGQGRTRTEASQSLFIAIRDIAEVYSEDRASTASSSPRRMAAKRTGRFWACKPSAPAMAAKKR